MRRTAVLNVVGLTEALIGADTPRITGFLRGGAHTNIRPAFPAVTCTAQTNYLTGKRPEQHGIVGNGWYHRDLAEVQFWKQSNHLVQAPKLWEDLCAQDARFTCAQLFWWYNMYASVDYSITPRPIYLADGRKVFDIYAWPYSIRPEIKGDLGEFPFTTFWGPAAGLETPQGSADAASRWIAASACWIETKHQPTLSLVYLPHLDYNLQRWGPLDPRLSRDLRQIDTIVGELIDFFCARDVQVVLLSEYGLSAVDTPIHLNRLFRERGWLALKEELGRETLDAGASRVFAVADHQVAHVYVNDRALEKSVRDLLEKQEGIDAVLGSAEKAAAGVGHPRAGELIAVAAKHAWFTYYYWQEEDRAPDFARTVDIHRKPGYDPVELFLDPGLPLVKLRILGRLMQKRLGFRMLMDVIPLDATLVKGSHGAMDSAGREGPIFAVGSRETSLPASIDSTEVYGLLRRLVTG